LYERHYSKYHYKDGRKPKLFCGPGEKIVLRTWEGDANEKIINKICKEGNLP